MTQSILRGALTDENGQGDIAYIAMGGLGLAVLGPILVMTAMSMVAHFRCVPHTIVVKEALTVIACPYDPQPLGTAIGLACGGFGIALGALAGYMAATRKPQGSSTTTTRVQETVTAGTVAAAPLAATADEPLEVHVTNPNPVPVTIKKPAPKGKAKR